VGTSSWKNKKLSSSDRMRTFRTAGSYAILIMAVGAMTFMGTECTPSGDVSLPTGSAATVGPFEITSLEFRREYQRRFAEMSRSNEQFNPADHRLAERVLNDLISRRIIYYLAQQNGIGTARAEVEAGILQQGIFNGANGRFSQELFSQYLRQNLFSEASFLKQIQFEQSVEKFQNFVMMTTYKSKQAARLEYQLRETKIVLEHVTIDPDKITINISAGDIKEFLENGGAEMVAADYESRTTEYNQPEQRKARHILVSFRGARNASGEALDRTKEQAKARAESLLAQVKSPGGDFEKIASTATDDPTGKGKGGDLGWFTQATMGTEVADVAFALRRGQVSGVVESPFGFHIIKLDGIRSAKAVTLEEATDEIARRLIKRDKQPALAAERSQQIETALNDGGDINALLRQYSLQWQTTEPFSAESRNIPGLGSSFEVRQALGKMQEVGQMYPERLFLGGKYAFIRLKSRTEPDMAKVGDEELEQMQRMQAYQASQTLLQAYYSQVQKEFEERDRIHRNPVYVTWDQANSAG